MLHPPAASRQLNDANIVFAGGTQLRELVLLPDGSLRLAWSLPPEGPGDLMVAVHLLDAAGGRIAGADHPLTSARPGPAGHPQRVLPLPTANWTQLGIGLYRPPSSLLTVQAARTDWDGHRALVNRPQP